MDFKQLQGNDRSLCSEPQSVANDNAFRMGAIQDFIRGVEGEIRALKDGSLSVDTARILFRRRFLRLKAMELAFSGGAGRLRSRTSRP